MTQSIKRIGEKNITAEELYKAVYKAMGFKKKVNRKVGISYIKKNLVGETLIYHPIWLVKSLIVAARPPFRPKKIPRIIFVDAVSGYRGIFSHVPPIVDETVDSSQAVKPFLYNEEEIKPYVENVQEKQINRQYMLKKPVHEVVETSLVHLPIYIVKVHSEEIEETFYINGNTGESEKFLSERWIGKKDLL